jgi:hypothetical protein
VTAVTAILMAACWLGIEAAGGGQVAAIAVATIAATAAVTLGTVWVSRAHDREVATNTIQPVQCTGSGVAESSAQSPPTIAFEPRPRYPKLEFSIVNGQPVPIQITAIRVVKAASIKAEYDAVRFLTGSRIELKFNVRAAEHGEWVSAFPGQVRPEELTAQKTATPSTEQRVTSRRSRLGLRSVRAPTPAVLGAA